MKKSFNLDEFIGMALSKKNRRAIERGETGKGCNSDANIIALYVDNRLNSVSMKKFENHLAACPDCRKQVQETLNDMSLFGMEPLKRENPGKKALETIIQIMKDSMEILQNSSLMRLEPTFAAATRGKSQNNRKISCLSGQIRAGKNKLKISLYHNRAGKVQLGVECLTQTKSPLVLELWKKGKPCEKKIIHGKGQNNSIDFGTIGKGHFELKTMNASLFAFTVK